MLSFVASNPVLKWVEPPAWAEKPQEVRRFWHILRQLQLPDRHASARTHLPSLQELKETLRRVFRCDQYIVLSLQDCEGNINGRDDAEIKRLVEDETVA
jgi:hypothetical protein